MKNQKGGDHIAQYRKKNSFLSKNPEKREAQLANLLNRNRELNKTGEVKKFTLSEYQKNIIEFAEKEIYLPEKKNQLITLENWEKEVFRDCFYANRPRLILISLAKKNGKSTFSAIVLNWFLITQEPGELYICSNSKDQSNFITYKKVVSMIRKNKELDKTCRVYSDVIENIKTGTILRCLSSSHRSSSGLNCLLVCLDEISSFDTNSLNFFYEELQLSPVYQNPLILITSTCGREEAGILWNLFKESEKGNTPESYFYIKQGDLANPSSFVTPKYLVSQENKPGMRSNLFKRLHKNLWVNEEDSFINDSDYQQCVDFSLKRRPSIKIPVWVGLDVGVRNDYTAIVSVSKADNKIILVDHKIYIPTKTEELQFDDVKLYFKELSKLYDIQGVFYDPYQAISLSQDLKKENIKMVELAQTQSNTIAFSQCLYNLIKSKGISFYQSEEIRLSLINCKVLYSDRGWRIVKKGTGKIDVAVALAEAVYGLTLNPIEGGPHLWWIERPVLSREERLKEWLN